MITIDQQQMSPIAAAAGISQANVDVSIDVSMLQGGGKRRGRNQGAKLQFHTDVNNPAII